MNMNKFFEELEKLFEQNKKEEALGYVKEFSKGREDLISEILFEEGVYYGNKEKHQEAIFYFELSRKITKDKELKKLASENIANAYFNLGIMLYHLKRHEKAEKAFSEALVKYKDLEKEFLGIYTHNLAETLNNLGVLYRDIGKFSEAEKVFKEILEKYRSLAEKHPGVYISDIAETLNNLGILYSDTGKFSEAEKAYTEALEIGRTLAEENLEVHIPHVAKVLNNLGILYRNIGKFPKSEKAYIKALEIRRTFARKNPEVYTPLVAGTLNNLGGLYIYTRKFFEAEKAYTEALERYRILAEKNPDVYMHYVAGTLNNLGKFYKDIGKLFEAEKAYTEALEIRRNLAEKNPDVYIFYVAETLNNLGILYKYTEKFSDAEKFHKKALEIRRDLAEKNPDVYTPDLAMSLNNLGNLYSDMWRPSRAEKAYTEALERYRILARKNPEVYTTLVAGTLNNLGILYSNMKKCSQAERIFKEALEKYNQMASWFDAAKVAQNLSFIKSDNKILESSRELLEMAILFSKEERYRYAQKGTSEIIYLSLLERDISTFGVLEALRDPQLLSLSWDSILSEEELEKAQKDRKFQKILVKKILKKQVPYPKPILTDLPGDLLFVYIQEFYDHILFYVLGKGIIQNYTSKKEFFSIGSRLFKNLIMQQNPQKFGRNMPDLVKEFEDLSKNWYETLPQGIRKLIQEKDQIVLSPDGFCSFFPLEAIPVDGETICIKKTVVRATSLHQFLNLLKKEPSFDSSLILANPWPKSNKKKLNYSLPQTNFKFSPISFLNSAEEEAKMLVEKLPNPTILLRDEATGERFLSGISKHAIIHFSGHGSLGRILFFSGPWKGFAPPFEPEEFSILRKAERTEGSRRISMMQDWHPITDLDLFDMQLKEGVIVFLNACETGQQRYAGGGYYQGLPGVFLKNGAFSVVSSLLPLFGGPSKDFAIRFYEKLLKKHSVTEALKEARIWIKDKYRAQIHWVPYLHYGPPL